MATVQDIITRAMRKIGAVAHDEAMTADQAENGLGALNMMMHSWSIHVPTWSHTDTTLDAEMPLAPIFHEGAVYQLASRLAPDFGAVGFDPDQWFRSFQAYYLAVQPSSMSAVLLNTASQRRWVR